LAAPIEFLATQLNQPNTVMAGLDPAIQERPLPFVRFQIVEQIAPIWIGSFDQIQFPLSRPSLQTRLSLDRKTDVLEVLVPNEHVDAIPLREHGPSACPMLQYARVKSVRYAGIERPVSLTRKNVSEAVFHLRLGSNDAREWCGAWMAGSSPAMTG
jgi:hypothetical protein